MNIYLTYHSSPLSLPLFFNLHCSFVKCTTPSSIPAPHLHFFFVVLPDSQGLRWPLVVAREKFSIALRRKLFQNILNSRVLQSGNQMVASHLSRMVPNSNLDFRTCWFYKKWLTRNSPELSGDFLYQFSLPPPSFFWFGELFLYQSPF